jgi:hypothetical protein
VQAQPDTFTPRVVKDVMRQFDQVLGELRDEMGLANAIYLTRFWQWYVGWGSRRYGKRWRWQRDGTETEDNRLWKEVQTYTAALYPRASRVMCSPDPMDRGDPKVGQAVLNAWWDKEEQYETVRDAVEMAILFAGAGFKVGYDPGTGSPIERTYLEAIPPWEILLDRNATSKKTERYRGHVYYSPVREIEERYPQLVGKLAGSARKDFLWVTSGADTPPNDTNNPDASGISADDDGLFVRVLEFVNLRDSVTGKSGEVYRGRLEVWILNQSAEVSDTPVAVTPLPFADADGKPKPHIVPLMFAHEPGYPLRPVAPVARLLPLQVTLNRLETAMLGDVKRNARKGLVRRGALDQDAKDKFFSGVDMEFAETDAEGSLREVAMMFEHQPIPADTLAYKNSVDQRLQRQAGGSPNARQEVTGATAYEVQTVQLFTEEGLKFHALLLQAALSSVSCLALRAIMVAGVDDGDSEGGKVAADQQLAAVGTADRDSATMATDSAAEAGATPAAPVPAKDWRTFHIKSDDETLEVTRDALDGDFPIKFVQGERTPISDQAMLQFLTGPGIQQYMTLWGLVQKGGPEAVIAERVMQQIAERADLPKDLHPGEMKAALQRQMAEEAAKGGPPKPPPGAVAASMGGDEPQPPPEAPQAPQAPPVQGGGEGSKVLMGALQTVLGALQGIVQADPNAKAALQGAGQAVSQAIQACAAGDLDGVKQAVLGARQALSAVQMEDPRLNAAREGVAKIVKAVAGDTLPDSRAMNVSPGSPEALPA